MSLPKPITRKEQYYDGIAKGNASKLPEPITREEQYLEYIAKNGGGGGGGTTDYEALDNKPSVNSVELSGNKTLDDLGIQGKLTFDNEPTEGSQNPVKSGGVYEVLESLVDAISEKPDEYADLNDKPSINSVELSGNKTASELGLQAELDGTQTVSGNPITVTDAEPMNAEGVIVELEPKQDLHGYDAPWVGGSGKNKLDEDYSTNYTNAVKLTAGTYYYQGFVGDVPSHTNTRLEFSEDNSTWEMVGIPSTDARITTSGWDGGWLESGIATMTFTTTAELYFRVWIVEGTLDNRHLSISSEQLTTFAPYSNICPITGYSEVNVERVGKNRFDVDTCSLDSTQGIAISNHTIVFTNNFYIAARQTIYLHEGEKITLSYHLQLTSGSAYVSCRLGENIIIHEYRPTATGDYSSTFTAPTTGAYYFIFSGATDDATGVFSKIQVEVGNQATTYEPYQGNTYTIDLDGTKYGGTLDVTEGGYSDEWGYYTIDGDNVKVETSEFNGAYVVNEPSGMVITATDQQVEDMMCDSIQVTSITSVVFNGTYGVAVSTTSYLIFLRLPSECGNNASEVNTWLQSNPISIAYHKTPSSVSTTPTDIPLLENTNNISTDGTNITLKYQPNNVIGECKAYTDEKCSEVLPPLPTTDGTYHLSCEVTSGVGVLSRVSDS